MGEFLPSPITIPVRQTTVQAVKMVRDRAINIAADLVRKVAGDADIIARDGTPTDLNNGTALGRASNSSLTANTATSIYTSFKLSATQAAVFYGYTALAAVPLIDQITFGLAGAGTFAQVEPHFAYAEEVPTIVFEPVPFQPNESPVIQLLSGAGISAAEQFVILFILADLAGNTVASPRQVSHLQRLAS